MMSTETASAEVKSEGKPTPAKKPEEKPIELPEFEKGLSDKITEKFGDKVEVAFVKEDRVRINVGSENVHDVAEFIRDEMNFDHVESVSGVDFPQDKEIEVVYHIGSYSDSSLSRQVLVLATRTQREENPIPGKDATKLPTLRDIFYSVEFHEREIFEMLVFSLKDILIIDDYCYLKIGPIYLRLERTLIREDDRYD